MKNFQIPLTFTVRGIFYTKNTYTTAVINKLFQEIGLDYQNTILIPVVEIANREKATAKILSKLKKQLSDKI